MVSTWIILGVLQLLDGWTTWQILRFGGVELDSIMLAMMHKFGTHPGLILAKIAVAVASWCAMIYHPSLPLWVWGGITGMFGGVVINNLLVMRAMGHLNA